MLDILTIVYSFSDIQTASRIRRTCRRLAALTPEPTLYVNPDFLTMYEYRVGNKLHRLDGPARKSMYGYTYWYRGGTAHREYHPYTTNGDYIVYMAEDVYHRETGQAILSAYGANWYLRGKRHRKTGPANVFGIWYTLGKMHRLDGPVYDDVCAIRGVKHNISCSACNGWWVVDGMTIRI